MEQEKLMRWSIGIVATCAITLEALAALATVPALQILDSGVGIAIIQMVKLISAVSAKLRVGVVTAIVAMPMRHGVALRDSRLPNESCGYYVGISTRFHNSPLWKGLQGM